MKNFASLILCFAFLGFVVINCSNQTANKPTTNAPAPNQTLNPTPEQTPIVIKAEQLTAEYSENEIAADGKYKGKILEVSGTIKEIAETMGKLTVQLEGHKEKGFSLVSVMCSFAESDRESISKLKKGQTVTLTGKGEGKTLGFYVGLADCVIK